MKDYASTFWGSGRSILLRSAVVAVTSGAGSSGHSLAALLVALLTLSFSGTAPAAPAKLAELHVASQPAGAECLLDGTPCGPTPLTLTNLPPRAALLILTKPGYAESRQTVVLTPGAHLTVDTKLQLLTGLILVQSQPNGAAILINDAQRGNAPLLVTDLAFGNYRLRAEAPGTLPQTLDFTIDSRIPQLLRVTLPTSTAKLEVQSEPAAARVQLDGAEHGATPAVLEGIAPGSHTLTVASAGYADHTQKLQLESGQKESVNITLKPLPASLAVVSVPAGARVYLDNGLRGTAPVTLRDLAAGSYRLRLELPGHAVASRTVSLGKGSNVVEEVRLENVSGSLELVTDPSGVNALLDGTSVGTTVSLSNATDQVSAPLLIQWISEGPHSLQLTRQGYFSATVPITIRQGETLPLHQTLKRRFIPNYQVNTAAGVDRGVLIEVDADRNIRLEVRPGVIKKIPAAEVVSAGPLREQSLPEVNPPEDSTSPTAPPGAKPDPAIPPASR